jgi:hypothetical protein
LPPAHAADFNPAHELVHVLQVDSRHHRRHLGRRGDDHSGLRVPDLGTRDGKRQADFAKDTEVVGSRVCIPASLLLFLAATGMMINLDLPWGQNWIVLCLIAFGLSLLVGVGFLSPESGRLAELIGEHGPGAPMVQARIRRLLTVSRCELVVLLSVVLNMVMKPVGQPGWFWGIFVVMVLGIAAVIAAYLRGDQQQRVPAAATDSYSYSSSSMRTAPAATDAPSSTCTVRTTAS